MRSIKQAGLLAAFLAAGIAGMSRASGEAEGPQTFSVAEVKFEQNATDGDVEVVFKVNGGPEGLERLSVISPDGRPVIQFSCPPPCTLGIRQFVFESPEPTDSGPLKAAFPVGAYSFQGKTVKGGKIMGTANLTHTLPPTTTVVHPRPDAVNIPAEDLQIRWEGVAGVTGYILEVDQEETGAHLAVRLPASSSSFAVPKGFLVPGRDYQLGIATRAQGGNISSIETTFTTAKQDSRK